MCLEFREERFSLLVADGGVDNHIVAFFPVYGGSNAVLVAGLKRVDDADDLVLGEVRPSRLNLKETHKVAACDGGVRNGEPDNLFWIDHENGADL
jgi:hypothetical protein